METASESGLWTGRPQASLPYAVRSTELMGMSQPLPRRALFVLFGLHSRLSVSGSSPPIDFSFSEIPAYFLFFFKQTAPGFANLGKGRSNLSCPERGNSLTSIYRGNRPAALVNVLFSRDAEGLICYRTMNSRIQGRHSNRY